MPGCSLNPASRAEMPTAAPPPPAGIELPAPSGALPSNGLAITSLVLGILGLCTMGFMSLVGLILGIVALKQINRDPTQAGGKNLAIAGIFVSAILTPVMFIVMLASLLFPIAVKGRSKARQAVCTSNQRQLALAVQMYAQDNGGQYPGTGWVKQITPYLGSSKLMFVCPEEGPDVPDIVSYGYSSALVLPNGQGVKEKDLQSPAKVGALCDASPSAFYPDGGLIGKNVTPRNRHEHGIIASFCDGHAKFYAEGFVDGDASNEVYRGFYRLRENGLLRF